MFFAANIHFAAVGTDYFAQEEPPSPLQHYWSLSVEEQFYLVWPALLLVLVLLAGRRGRCPAGSCLAVLVVLTGASFAWSLVSTASDPLAAYFSTLARAWELGLGALTALVAATVAARMPLGGARAGLPGGLALIGGRLRRCTATRRRSPARPRRSRSSGRRWCCWPAPAGTRPSQLPIRALGVRPMRVLGDWSYSLYLWHWPVLIIAERRVGALGFWRTALCLVVVFVLSALTYRYVEQPFRSPRRFPVRRALSLYPAAVAARGRRRAERLLLQRVLLRRARRQPGDHARRTSA